MGNLQIAVATGYCLLAFIYIFTFQRKRKVLSDHHGIQFFRGAGKLFV
jgi:hypothetical protein